MFCAALGSDRQARCQHTQWVQSVMPLGAQVNFFHFVAEEVRIGLAELGLKSLDDLIGRADLLKQRDLQLAKTQGLDLSFITSYAGVTGPSSVRSKQEVRVAFPALPRCDLTKCKWAPSTGVQTLLPCAERYREMRASLGSMAH